MSIGNALAIAEKAVKGAANQKPRPATITTPKGYRLKWTKATDPTDEDWARLKEWDDAQPPNNAGVGAYTGTASKPAPPPPKTLLATANPMGGPPAIPAVKGGGKQGITALQAGQKIDEKQSQFAETLSGNPFLSLLNAISPFKGSFAPTEMAATAAFAPIQTYASAGILTDEKSSVSDRIGAALELIRDLGIADTLVGKGVKAGLGAVFKKIGNAKGAKILRQYLATAPPEEISKVELKLRENFGRQGSEVKALPAAEPKTPGKTPNVDVTDGKTNVHYGPGTRPLTEAEIAKSQKKVGTKPSEIPAKPPKFDVGRRGPSGKLVPTPKPPPAAPETPKTTVPGASATPNVPPVGPLGAAIPSGDKETNISLAEAAKHDLSPEAPDPQSWDLWRSQAEERGHNTPEGVQKILDKAKKGHEPTPDETFGLGMHIADLLEAAGKATGDEKTKLIDRAREIYKIRHTQSARNIAARAALHQGEYKPGLVDSIYELETGKAPTPKVSKRINKQAQRVQEETAKINDISKQREGLRKAATPKFVEKGTPEQRIAKARTVIEKKYPRRLTGGYIDPEMLEPVAAMLRAKTEQLRGNVSRAVTELRNELSASYGWNVTNDDLLEAFKDVRKKRSLTEAEIRFRNSRARATAAINREIEAAGQPKIVKGARGIGRLSQEMRMADIVNRGIDAGSNVDELIQSSSFSPVERLIANAYLAATKDKTRFRGMSVAQRASISSKWGRETAEAMADAAGASGSRQSGNFSIMGTIAGVMDAPARAFNELRYAGEVAADIVKKNPHMDFSDVVDQIRQPAVGGPLSADDAMRYHDGMFKWGDYAMHTDENAISKLRGGFRSLGANASPVAKAAIDTADWFIFSFSKTLVNIADKGAQATVLPYGVARSTQQAAGISLTKNLDKTLRAKQLAQTIRRTAIGYGLMQVGYYWPEIQALAKEHGIDAPDQPDWMKGRIIETLDKNGKPTGNLYHEQSIPSQILGVMFAMSAGAKARQLDDMEAQAKTETEREEIASMKRGQWTDWLTNNTAWNTIAGMQKITDPNAPADTKSQRAMAWLVRLFTPTGFAKWAKAEDDVPSRQTKPQSSEGTWDWISQSIANELKNRNPSFFGAMPPDKTRKSLPPKSQVIK